MKMPHRQTLVPLLFLGLAPATIAQTLYWNPSPLTNTWDAISTHWATTSGGSPTTAWSSGGTAIFDQIGTYTVTLSGAQTATAFGFSNGSVTINLGGTSQTLANLTISAPSANTTATLTNGSLTLNGASDLVVTPGVTTGGRTALLDLSALSSLTISKAANSITVGGHTNGANPGNYGTFRLSATTNSITAANINIGTTSGANAGGVLNRGELYLGTANTIYANNWTLGNTRDSGLVQFLADLTNPSVTLRATDGTSRVTKITIGQNGAGSTGVGNSHFNLGAGTVDAMINELVVSRGASTSTTPAVNGSFSMGGGTLDATTIWLSKNEVGGLNSNTSSFTQGGGTVKVASLVFAQTTATGSTLPVFNSQYTLNGGTLRAGSIAAGTGVFATSSTRRINFNGGTITHYDASTDLLINGVTGTGGSIALLLGTAGSPTIEADTDRTVTLGQFTAVSGSGSLTKTGAGTLVLNSAATYSGSTTINGGTVTLGGADRLPTGTNLTLANTAGVQLNQNNNNQTLGSLSGGGSTGGNVAIGTAILKVGNANNTTFAGQLTGTGSFVKVGAGSLTLSGNTTASLTGLNISGGTLEITSGNYTITGNAAPSAPDSTSGFIVSRGGTFRLDGGNITATGGSYVITAGNTGGHDNQFILDSGTFDGGNREVLNSFGGTGTFTMNGGLFIGGEFRISQSAAGTVNLNGGTLRVLNLKYSNADAIVNFDGGTLQAKANRSDFITTTVTQANIRAGGATIDSNGFNITIPKALTEDTNSTGGGLTKIGSGTLTLSAANTYTGATDITGGTLALTGAGSIASSSAIKIGANTTLDVSGVTGGWTLGAAQTLEGTGTVTGNANISGNLAPGASIGKLNFDNNLTIDSDSTFSWEMTANETGRGTAYDAVNVAGSLAGSGGIFKAVLTVGSFADGFWTTNRQWTDIFKTADAGSNLDFDAIFSGFQYWEGETNVTAGIGTYGSFSISGSTLNWTAIPEPGTALAGLLLAAGLFRRRRGGGMGQNA
jgi:autotransporter-associated beta strand protein